MLEASLKMKLFFPVRPWESEPDHAEWIQEPSGYKCRIKRNEITGVLLGYVGIPKGHKFWGMNYDSHEELSEIGNDVHGGLTYSDLGKDGWWYFGFDTNHFDDFAPKLAEYWFERGYKDLEIKYSDCTKYKTWEYVEDQIYWLGKRLWQYNEYEKEDKDE